MEINKELKHIAEYQNSILPRHQKRTEEAIEIIANDAIESLKNRTFDFKSFLHLDLNQNGKHRQVIMYKPFSPEELLCIFLKRVLDRKFHISYPNRNEYIRTLFDTAAAIKDMSDYTIFKFDFSDFFNTVSSEYVYHKYIQSASLERYQDKLMANFVNATKYTFAGLNTSNILCEIIARDFDQRLVQRFSKQGIILYKRYIDDGIMILNRYVEQNDCLEIVNDVIKEVFLSPQDSKLSPCKTALNLSKVRYIAGRCLAVGGPSEAFDFLGYEFELKKILTRQQKQKTEFRYGITQAKIDKYTQKIEDIVKEYVLSPQKDIELLRHRMDDELHFSKDELNHKKLINLIRRYSFVFEKGNMNDLCNWFVFFHDYSVPLLRNTEAILEKKLREEDNPILWANYLIYSRYHSDYHKEILIWVEELLQYKVNQIGSKDPLLQKEFWYVITFINCPYISGSVKTALEGIVRPMATAAETNLANKIKKIIAEFLLQNKSNLFFCWGYYHFNTSKQLTFRTYQRTLFKQYKNKRSIELYGSLDT